MKGPTKTILIAVLAVVFLSIFPQKIPSQGRFLYCVVDFQMENKDRYCYGDDLFAECGEYSGPIYHDPPFGNWGVDSNLQVRSDGNQFLGWEKKWSIKTFAWQWQWNSCTGKYPWDPPNCKYYNAANCWEQETSEGIGGYAGGVTYIEIPRQFQDDG